MLIVGRVNLPGVNLHIRGHPVYNVFAYILIQPLFLVPVLGKMPLISSPQVKDREFTSCVVSIKNK